MDEFTYEGAGQRHWTDEELFPRSPLPIQGLDDSPGPRVVEQAPSMPLPPMAEPQAPLQSPAPAARQPEPLFIAPGASPRNDPFMPPPGRSYAHPRLAPTWQHASLGAAAGLDTIDVVHRLLVVAGMAGLGWVAVGKWQGAAAGCLMGIGVNQFGQFALTKSWLRAGLGLAGLGGGGYWMWKLKGGSVAAVANKAKSWLQPIEESSSEQE